MNKPAKIAISVAALTGAVLFGTAAGMAGAQAPPEPEVITETVEVPGEAVTETVEVTPRACIDALDAADQIAQVNADAFEIAGESIVAASQFDSETLDKNNARIASITGGLTVLVDKYNAAGAKCRDAA